MRQAFNLAILCAGAVFLAACGKQADSAQDVAPPPTVGIERQPDASAPTASVRTFAELELQQGFFQVDPATTLGLGSVQNRCTLERINGEKAIKGQPVVVAQGGTVTFNGWISDPQLQLPNGFMIVLSGDVTYALNATAGQKRQDVAKALNSEALLNAGFRVKEPLGMIVPGTYTVILLQEKDGVFSRCTTPGSISVAG